MVSSRSGDLPPRIKRHGGSRIKCPGDGGCDGVRLMGRGGRERERERGG
jgi:hypothetical protein